MSKALYDELNDEVQGRENQELIAQATMLTKLYDGELPPEYNKYFPSNAPKHIVQLIKNAADSLVPDVGRMPDFRSETLDETAREEKFVAKHERIAQSYLDSAEPSGKLFMKQLAWWLVVTGRAFAYVKPDSKNKKPVMTVRDHRNVYPNMRTAGNIPVELFDVVMKYEVPRKDAVGMGLAETKRMPSGGPYQGDQTKIQVIEYLDEKNHIVVSEDGLGTMEAHNLGVVPGWMFQTFSPNKEGGMALFKDQVSLMVAVSMLISLKLASADKTVNPIYVAKGWQGSVKIGPNVVNKVSTSGDFNVIPPPQLPQVDRDIGMLVQFSNILNRNPEVRQGQVDAKGQYVSAKTLDELASSIDGTIADYWDTISVGKKNVIHACYAMDEKLWPNEEKRITTNIRGRKQRDLYVPSRDINGRYDIECDYGFGMGGYQGFLQHLQAKEAKVMSRKRAMESMPGISDIDTELRQIQIEDLDEAGMALLQSQAASGQLDMLLWARMREDITKGKELHEVIKEMEEEARAQAEQAQTQGGAEAITTPPAAPPGSVEGVDLRALPGLNPGALV